MACVDSGSRGSRTLTGSRTKRFWGLAALIGVIVVAAVVGWLLVAPTSGPRAARTENFEVVEVKRQDLTIGVSLQGTLGYGPREPIPLLADGIVTWLPREGMRAELGDTLLKIDNRPVVLLYGRTPAFRRMTDNEQAADTADDVPADDRSAPAGRGQRSSKNGVKSEPPTPVPSVGPDVEQLELGLSKLGYGGFTVDDTFTSGTAEAVRRWQADLGLPPTGAVELGDVVFLPGPIRLHPASDAIGKAANETSVEQTGTTAMVTAEASDTAWATAGTPVDVTFPNGRRTAAAVAGVSRQDDSESGGGVNAVRFRLQDPPRKIKPGPVTVTYVASRREHVLAVPVTALVALAEGGYGVQAEDGTFVAVTPGLYADGLVEIDGDVREGQRIRVPR